MSTVPSISQYASSPATTTATIANSTPVSCGNEQSAGLNQYQHHIGSLRFERGFCPECGMEIYQVDQVTKTMVPITAEFVLKGRCLLCHPIPQNVQAERHVAALQSSSRTAVQQDTASFSELSGNNMHLDVDQESFEDDDIYIADIDELMSCMSNKGTKKRLARNTSEKNAIIRNTNKSNNTRKKHKQNDSKTVLPAAVKSMPLPVAVKSMPISPSSVKSSISLSTNNLVGESCQLTDGCGVIYVGRLLSGTIEKGKVEVKAVEVVEVENKQSKTSKNRQKPTKFVESSYKGDVLHGKFHGKGIMIYDQSTYDGYFQNGEPNGYGVCTWQCGQVYAGEWLNDERHGVGKSYNTNSGHDAYDGEWQFDNYHGHGILKYAGGHVYEGSFVNGNYDGQGTYIYSPMSNYKGQFKGNKRSGHGTMIYSSGETYVGEWVSDECRGEGVLEQVDGVKYDGTFFSKSYFRGTIFRPDGNRRHIEEKEKIYIPK